MAAPWIRPPPIFGYPLCKATTYIGLPPVLGCALYSATPYIILPNTPECRFNMLFEHFVCHSKVHVKNMLKHNRMQIWHAIWILWVYPKGNVRPRTKSSWIQEWSRHGCAKSRKFQKILKFRISRDFYNFHKFCKNFEILQFLKILEIFKTCQVFWDPPAADP